MRRRLCLLALLPACVGPGTGSDSSLARFAYVVLTETERVDEMSGDPDSKGMFQDLLRAHENWLGALTDTRLLLAAGPLSSGSSDSGEARATFARGLLLLDLETKELIDGVVSRNPAIAEGLFAVETGVFESSRTLRRAPFLDLVARSLEGGGDDSFRPEATAVDYLVVLAARPGPLTTGLEGLESEPILEATIDDGRPVVLYNAKDQGDLEDQVGSEAKVFLWRSTKGLRAIAVEPRVPGM